MQKNKAISITILNLLIALMLSVGFICGKGDGNSSGDNKSGDEKKTETTEKKDGSFSTDKPFMVEFEVTGGGRGKGTVTAIYSGAKCRSTSNFDIGGKQMGATAYFDGGDVVYTVTEVAGNKM